MNFDKDVAISYMRGIMPGNKALGILAQLDFQKWVKTQDISVANKFFGGCWIVALNEANFYALRTCFFVWPTLLAKRELPDLVNGLSRDRQFHGMCSSLAGNGFDVIYCFALFDGKAPSPDNIDWRAFRYSRETLGELELDPYFSKWKGRGRQSRGKEWTSRTIKRFRDLSEEDLTALLMPQLFYNGLFKAVYHARSADPYDVDGFIVSYDGKVFPIELKEKFPFGEGDDRSLGVDVGRVLMMLRIALPSNSNGFYFVREVEDTPQRKLVGWKAIRLDEILMKCTWQGQGGGPGMASGANQRGSQTSTIIIPYACFYPLDSTLFADNYLRENASLTETTRRLALRFVDELKATYGFI
jgi:hypothetical protein